jgi:hypothetical protein
MPTPIKHNQTVNGLADVLTYAHEQYKKLDHGPLKKINMALAQTRSTLFNKKARDVRSSDLLLQPFYHLQDYIKNTSTPLTSADGEKLWKEFIKLVINAEPQSDNKKKYIGLLTSNLISGLEVYFDLNSKLIDTFMRLKGSPILDVFLKIKFDALKGLSVKQISMIETIAHSFNIYNKKDNTPEDSIKLMREMIKTTFEKPVMLEVSRTDMPIYNELMNAVNQFENDHSKKVSPAPR